jgi:putative ATP-binding cassette transporter
VQGLTVRPPGGSALLHVPQLTLAQGERLLVTGRSGSGKSGLVRTLAGLWPGRPGSLEVPAGTLFIGQRPYLPDGPLAEALAYPLEPGAFELKRLVEALGLAGMTRLAPLLGESRAWSRRLSPGEQQRLQFARIFLLRPRWVVLDEASSALDDAAERRLHETLHTLLPDTAVLSVGHHAALRRWHERELQVQGGELRAPRGEPIDAQGGVAPTPAWRRDGPSGSPLGAQTPSAGSAPPPRTSSPRRAA